MGSTVYLCVGLLLLITQAIEAANTFRLQRDAIPSSYSLELLPNYEGDTFDGDVTIFLHVEKPIRNISLNNRKLMINEITLDQAYDSTKYILDRRNEIMQVFYENGDFIEPGEHILNIKFTGMFGPYVGFYKLDPSVSQGRTMLATKFSSNNARAAFPCFDEPFYKSTFNIRLMKPNNSWEALSNMREIGRVETPKGIAVDFESTLPMSTYLLAWVVTDYTYDEMDYISQDQRIIPLRFYQAGEKNAQLRNALESTKKALAFFENYTDVQFPLPKLDSITIPSYRSRGMEHYGLVIYQDQAIFTKNPFHSKLYSSIEADLLICHEISHMWFGNLVTHQWYNDLWLTEGFARYMQYKAGEAIYGDRLVKLMFQESKYLSLFELKCYGDTVYETASYPRKLNELYTKYGPTTYDQGGALLLMLEDLIGSENFRDIIRQHLKQHQFGHSTTGEFINLVDNAVPTMNVRDMMESFLFQNKLPLVTVKVENDSFVLQQSALCNDGPRTIFTDKWTFPIKYITGSNMTSNIVWFDREMERVTIPRTKSDEWIQVNQLNSGLYRAVYTRELYENMAKNIEKLEETDVGPLVEDAFFMSSIGKIPCDVPLKLLNSLKSMKNISFITYTYASRSFSMFQQNFSYDYSLQNLLKAYFFSIFENLYNKLTWKVKAGDSMDDRMLRMEVLESFCLGYPRYKKCESDAVKMRLRKEAIHPDIEYIYKAVLRTYPKRKNPTEVIGATEEQNYTPEINPGEGSCVSWIKQNIPKITEETVYIVVDF